MSPDHQVAFDVLARALAQCHSDRVTGALHVVGNPGGQFYLRDGTVIAVDSPGSPGAETLLLRSGRITEEDWATALREGTGTRAEQAMLAARGAIGPRGLQVLVTMAMQDGAFATAAGTVERYVVDDRASVDVLLTAPQGMHPDLLLAEATRRLNALASMPFPLSPYRERVAPRPEAKVRALSTEQRMIIASANGRRTARDIAFAVGRSVYPVAVDISRMLTEGLVEIAPPATSFRTSSWGVTSVRPRAQPVRGAHRGTDPTRPLPCRRPGTAVPDAPNFLRPSGWRPSPEMLNLSEAEGKNVGL